MKVGTTTVISTNASKLNSSSLIKMIKIVRGDITSLLTEVIVNAANTSLLSGSGVCGAIDRVAGPELERKCRELGSRPTGEARITEAYDLPCKHVIHAVGPRYWDATKDEADLLALCYKSIFDFTEEYEIETIWIPAIGTGIYRYPVEKATEIAFDMTLAAQGKNQSVVFVCFDEDTTSVYQIRQWP